MSQQFLGRSQRKRKWRRGLRIDSCEKLDLVVELIKKAVFLRYQNGLEPTLKIESMRFSLIYFPRRPVRPHA